MEKSPQIFHLPKLQLKQSTSFGVTKPIIPCTSRSSLQVILKELKFQQLIVKKKQQTKRQEGYKRFENSQKVYERASILQKKKLQIKDRISFLKEEFVTQNQVPTCLVVKYDTFWKPPHRYKTAMAFYDQNLLLYGGFGCEKYMGLAKLSLKVNQWQIPKLENNSDRQIALYGHTMGMYRHNLFIFGGVKLDSPTNELLVINLKNEQISQLISAPFRRKDHAMSFLSKYMIIQGGIQNGNEINNTLFYFDCESGRWSVPQQFQMPFLSHHSMVSIPPKLRKKNNTLQDILGDSVYIFGGKNQKEVSQNKLHRLRVRQTGDLTTQQIFGIGAPQPRHSSCFQFIQPFYLCVYGGKSDQQESGPNLQCGIFNDCSLFDIERKEWIIPQVNLELPYRFGASCCASKNKFFIFGGNQKNGYSDGNLLEMTIRNENKGGGLDEETTRKTHFRG